MKTFWADFNEVVNGDFIRVSMVLDQTDLLASAPVGRGELVLLVDGDGNSCYGETLEVEDELLTVSLDWDSWSSTSVKEFRHPGDWLATDLTQSDRVHLTLVPGAA